ncbi:MAG TPA: hypothetical protein VMH32_19905 [Burkholderiales bacterium]|nr:hypothetical protein [Burkholderiales bacterium]
MHRLSTIRERFTSQVSVRLCLSGAVLLVLSACSTFYTSRHPMPIAEVVNLSKSGAPPPVIIQRIRDTGTTYALRGSDFAKLKADGVPDPVLDYLQQSFVDDIDLQTRYWVENGGIGGCRFCYPQPVDVDKLESGYGVVPAPPPGRYEVSKPMGTPDWVPYPPLQRSSGSLSVQEIEKMAKDGTADAQIIERINRSNLTNVIGVGGTFTIRSQPVAGLYGSELARLHSQGVSYAVLDALQGKFLAQFIEAERLRYTNMVAPGPMR